MFKVTPQNEEVCKEAKHRNRRGKFQVINHQRACILLSESMIVPEIAEWTFHHRVLKMKWPIHLSYRDSHVQPQAKMSGSPLYLLSLTDQAGSNAADGLLFGRGNRVQVKIDAPSKIKASSNRGANIGFKSNFRGTPSRVALPALCAFYIEPAT